MGESGTPPALGEEGGRRAWPCLRVRGEVARPLVQAGDDSTGGHWLEGERGTGGRWLIGHPDSIPPRAGVDIDVEHFGGAALEEERRRGAAVDPQCGALALEGARKQ
jgi:hypothetical protein